MKEEGASEQQSQRQSDKDRTDSRRQAGWSVMRRRTTRVIRESDTNVTVLTFHALSHFCLFASLLPLVADLKPCTDEHRPNAQHGS